VHVFSIPLLAFSLALLSGCFCGTAPREDPPDERVTVYVVSHGWHAGIVFDLADVPAGWWPEQSDFPGARYVDIGWGDSAYYQSPRPGPLTALRAGLFPTPSVLHVAAFAEAPETTFRASEVIRIPVSPAGFARMIGFINESFQRGEDGKAISTGPGLYLSSRFYVATGRYHVFENCNHWTARALRAAGVPVAVSRSITVDLLLCQVRRHGAVIRPPEHADQPSSSLRSRARSWRDVVPFHVFSSMENSSSSGLPSYWHFCRVGNW
jgi:uncharacterized protein (TIGR02117 family)